MANNELNIALIQTPLVWENPEANRHNFEQKIEQVKSGTDLIVLPEMFTTGFTMNPEKIAETMEGDTVKWMKGIAARNNFAVLGSVVIDNNGDFFNRAIFVHPSGDTDSYDKRHTFTLAGENEVYKAGLFKKTIDYRGWKICPLICYDLRFPVWSRNIENYDVLVYMANWPKPRINAWDTLLKARAIENMSYCVGVNRIGEDEKNNEYSGHSAVYDVLGNEIAFSEKEEIIYATLDKVKISKYREKLKFLEDKDKFSLM